MSRRPSLSTYIGRPSWDPQLRQITLPTDQPKAYLVCLMVELRVIFIDFGLLLKVEVPEGETGSKTCGMSTQAKRQTS